MDRAYKSIATQERIERDEIIANFGISYEKF